MYYLILVLTLLALTILTYYIFNKDILSPSFIVCLTYLISSVCAYVSKVFDLWNYIELREEEPPFLKGMTSKTNQKIIIYKSF